MIYRAIIEKVIDRYTAKVRIPSIHRSSTSNKYTHIEDLPEAKVCTPPNNHINMQIGDVVIVSFENNDSTKPVILGYLYTADPANDTSASSKISTLQVAQECALSKNTSIGNVTSSEISALEGIRDNIQYQIDLLTAKLVELENKLKVVENLPTNADPDTIYFIK